MRKSFGLSQPTLIQQIKKILDQYPDDGQILKELIQNAEDAGAKKVKFLYDYHSYGIKKLHHPKLAKFQGPALYTYNDAKFTDKDWDGIGKLCESIKEKDPTKVGRFGLGFKSVFHMTDLPSVISGDSVGIIDPEEKYFSDTDGKRSGRKWHLSEDRRILRKISDQFATYKGIFGCDEESFERGSYEGTLFRLPLRKEASQLSETIYSQEKMKGLFECFEKDAHLILLFLMNLERIEVYKREAHSSQPRKLFHVGISDHCLKDVRNVRKEFKKKLPENSSDLSDGSFSEVTKTFPLTIETVHYNNGVGSKAEHSFVVTLFFSGSNITQEVKALMTDKSLSYLPLVGVALPLQPQMQQEDSREEGVNTNYDNDNEYADQDDDIDDDDDDDIDDDVDIDDDDDDDVDIDDDDDDDVITDDDDALNCRENENSRNEDTYEDAEPQGHLFCFLPLPLENKSLTGLPVHVNGFFALSQNRRHLKWPSADQDETMQSLTDKSLLWNKGLLQEVLPKAYAELILRVISFSSEEETRQVMNTSDVYNAWPDINKVDVKWKGILQPLFDALLQSEVLHTDVNGGGWCKAENVILDDMKRSDKSRKIVIDLLAKAGENVVTAPAHIKRALEEYCTFDLEYVTQEVFRTCLKSHPSCYTHLSHQDKILLLKFVLSDSDFSELEGLQLLPLSDKTFTTFRTRRGGPIYIDSAEHPKSLLPWLQRIFLDTELDDAVTEQLQEAVEEGYTQLRPFNVKAVQQYLRQTPPSDWSSDSDYVTWHPGISSQPTTNWLKDLWEYFVIHFTNTASHLDAFVGLPLLPLSPLKEKTKIRLARTQRPSSFVLASFNDESIDESVCHVLKALGLTILKDLPEYIQYYPGLVPSLANPPSPRGVLNAIKVFLARHDNSDDLIRKMRGIAADNIRFFRRFLSSMSSPLKESDYTLLKTLPLFEIFPGSGRKESQFVSLQKVNIGAPVDDLPPVNVFTKLLDLRENSSRVLAGLLNVKPMSHSHLLKIMLDDALENKYSQKELDKLVQYTLDRFGIFHRENFESIKGRLQHLSFVLSCSKSRKKPSELYDPEIGLLKQVFHGEDVFPDEKCYYSQPYVLSHLRNLGLKRTESVTANDILRSASLYQARKTPIRVDRAEVKFKAILKLLEQNPSLLNQIFKRSEALKSRLYSIPWIPVLTEKPTKYPTYLPLKNIVNGDFACPGDVKSHEFVNLVGSVKLLVDTRHVPKVSECFHWDQKPILEDVIGHLNNVIESFQERSYLDERRTSECLEEMYEYFQKALTEDTRGEVTKFLSPMNFILVRNQLFPARKLAFSSNVTYPPYLNQLPGRYEHQFDILFKAVGVRESFEIPDYIETLKMVKNKYEENPVTEELGQVTSILNSLADVMAKEEVSAKEAIDRYGSIYIPDSDEIMKPSEDVCVKDCYWMPSEPDVSYINKSVSPQVCISLGAKTMRQNTLRRHVKPLGVPFGQKEKLTNRLKRILTGYPCDESILKELLQNADDAKATKVCFIKDPRQHPVERVFEEIWKPLQGPALCVYNDAPFTENDIEGIQKLGEGSKGDDPNKTGQYGVGFNAVYHLTDAPTFISQGKEIGEVMCVFDPNLKFVPGAGELNPGVMYKDLPALRKKIPDVFLCYDHGKFFPLKNATLFRFPLRNEDMANTSKISNKTMTIEKLDHLLSDFKEELLQVLLFVNNVKEISICEIDKKTGKLNESYRVQSSLSTDDEEKRKDFAARVSKIGKRLQSGTLSVADIPVHQVSYVVNLKDSKGLNQKWFVVQKIGFEHKENIPDNVEEAFKKGDLGLLPRGGVASLIRSSKKYQDTQGKAFCFLPLPFKTGLPVHINGHFALNHEDRRSLWRDDKGDYRSNWNDALLRQVIAPCYVTLLNEVRQHISLPRNYDGKTYINGARDNGECVILNYFKYFPSFSVGEEYWKSLTREVYRHMNAGKVRLLPVLREERNKHKEGVCIKWLPPTGHGRDKAFFGSLLEDLPSYYDTLSKKMKIKAVKDSKRLRDTLLALGINLLFTTNDINIYHSFVEADVDVSHVSPRDVVDFFSTYNSPDQLCELGKLPSPMSKTPFRNMDNLLRILKYCKQDEEFFQRLEGLPLLLTEDKVLRVFSQSEKVFLSGYRFILPHCSSMFVHQKLFNDVFYGVKEAIQFASPVFKVFDIKAFADLLPSEMDETYRSTEYVVIWDPENKNNQIPGKQWIWHVWRFFSNFIEEKIKSYDEEQRSTRKYPKDYLKKKKLQECHELQDKEARKRITQEALDPVMNWCLLPAFEANPHVSPVIVKHMLLPIGMSNTVIVVEGSLGFDLKETLKKIILPQLNCNFIDGGYQFGCLMGPSKTARRLVAALEEPLSVLTVLLKKMTFDSSFNALQADDCLDVLRYFCDHLTELNPSTAEELKKLPLYETIHGDIISINGKEAFVLSSKIPKDEMHIWEETSGLAFLKESVALEKLYESLQCHSKDEVDVYCDIILDKFQDLSEEARIEHLTFVRGLLNELDTSILISSDEEIKKQKKLKLAKLSQALVKMKFITAQDGTLRTASSFYDPTNKVFAIMLENNNGMFPPKPFCDDKWLPFLRRIGLIHEVSNKQFLKFAKEVETEAKTRLNDGTRKKSEALLNYLFESENIATSALLADVKNICFIFPYVVDPRLQAIHEQYVSGKTGSPCICFRNSVASKNHSITWTTANILPRDANPFEYRVSPKYGNESELNEPQTYVEEVSRRLDILQNPTVGMVVDHFRNVCNVFNASSTIDYEERMEILTKIYQYLQENYVDGNEHLINDLQNIRCVVVKDEEQFVFPKQVVVEFTSSNEIRPYLYKIPSKLTPYVELFENLGTTTTVTCVQYAEVLRSIYMESANQKLDPNQISNAFKATKGLFETIDEGDQDLLTEASQLYLPGAMRNPDNEAQNMVFLRISTDILYNDAPHFQERIEHFNNLILVKLSECGLSVGNDGLLLKELPESIRPRMLTSVVHETLIEGEQQVSCSSTAQELRQVLTSSEFCYGMIRLIKHADYKDEVETSTHIPVFVQERLSCIRVYSAPNLQTNLVYNGTAIHGSEANVSCFEEETEEENEKVWKIYIEKDAELSKYVSVVAEIIDRITGHLLKTMLLHLPMLLYLTPNEIKGFLDGLKIREDNSAVLKIEATCLPTPGNFIHITDHHLLVDDFTVFSRGEYVGYELDDPSLRGEDATPTYIYAIVIEVFENGQPSNTEASLRKYRIDIGKDKEPVVVDAADLYKFYRPSQYNSECMELEPFTGSRDEKPANLDEIRKEIGRILQEAWKQPEEKRKKIVKRLFLKWHPDKNLGDEKFYTEIFEFILAEIERLSEEGEGGDLEKKCFGVWGNRAQCHRRQRSSFYGGGGFSTFSRGSYRSNPQPGEAKRWYKQAKADLKAASNDVCHERTSYEWACFKCHQSAEKALKAAQFSIDADKTNVHDLRMVAHDLHNDNLSRLASKLESLVGDSTRMRYPDRLCYPNIPHSVYTSTMASEAIDLASDIVKEVKSKFIN